MNTSVTRVFKNGNSQAVRIPADLRLNTDRVQIYRNARGDLVIHPLENNRGDALLEALSGFDDDFVDALAEVKDEQPQVQDREAL
ncbi:AbrB/MazE/SpoVT family DNA-binding domain-containing protein [Marinospirillum sp.]|uniref:antitoxin n=1 Tax=Marinospirillum sp. TaxID=2183934 RepID=UPI002870803E|nr:AbrB/MazE/SpoVT family DNA-binding domain-containing protein [Marinospirillum sp.]MDR9468934.1 AbrB/MazE/SpoVT family DNA-binding domain-containing protein [Marinospirillum sp.]